MEPAARLTDRRVAAIILVLVALAFALALYPAVHAGHPPLLVRGGLAGNVPPRADARAQPPAPPPPAIIANLTAEEARASNAAIPFVAAAIAPARPFRYVAAAPERSAALTCLAAAVLYEAGDDALGERAVAQVVLNRLRHPTFAKSVCGVVFEGTERRTGCQFTFTCDGALARPVNPDAWRRARDIAEAALAGQVFAPVGTATHYHTDWVVPYWRDGLEKVAQVHTQIFYRLPGWWGSRAAFTGMPQAPETIDPRLVHLAEPIVDSGASAPPVAGETPLPARTSLSIEGVPAAALKGSVVRLKDEATGQFVLELDASAFPGSWAVVGYTICGTRPECILMGWTSEAQTPRALPVLPSASPSMAFLYRKSRVLGLAQPFWDCTRFSRADRSQCLPGTAR